MMYSCGSAAYILFKLCIRSCTHHFSCAHHFPIIVREGMAKCCGKSDLSNMIDIRESRYMRYNAGSTFPTTCNNRTVRFNVTCNNNAEWDYYTHSNLTDATQLCRCRYYYIFVCHHIYSK